MTSLEIFYWSAAFLTVLLAVVAGYCLGLHVAHRRAAVPLERAVARVFARARRQCDATGCKHDALPVKRHDGRWLCARHKAIG
jgi:hypothetical protein